MSSIIETIKSEMEAFNQKRKEMAEGLRKQFPALLTPLFEQSEKINSIGWRQYTPYFNDGDECIFHVHKDDLTVNGVDEYDENEEERLFITPKLWKNREWVPNPDVDAKELGVYTQFKEVLGSIPDDFYKDLFGDHVEVTVNRDGSIETEEYDHD